MNSNFQNSYKMEFKNTIFIIILLILTYFVSQFISGQIAEYQIQELEKRDSIDLQYLQRNEFFPKNDTAKEEILNNLDSLNRKHLIFKGYGRTSAFDKNDTVNIKSAK